MYNNRTLQSFFTKASQQFPVMLVTGARQVGKTTFLKHISEAGRQYVTLDDPLVLALAKDDPALFMQRFKPPVVIDEIQYAPALLPYIKMEVDQHHIPGAFWLTGSQQFHLMNAVTESLSGRVGVVNILAMSRREISGQGLSVEPFIPTAYLLSSYQSDHAISLEDLYRIIWRGSFPAIALSKEMDRDLFFSSYVQTYLQRDVRDLARVSDEMAFLRFLRAAAARSGQLLNITDMARDADVSVNTGKSWLSILQSSGIVYLLEPYHSNVTKRLIKAPKLYFLDTGLCAYLTEWSSPQTLEAGAMSGAFLETWVISEILKTWLHNGLRPPFYYYRDKDQKEIDLLIVRDGTIYPIEIKKSASPTKDSVRHFKALEKLKMTIGPGGVICLANQSLPLTDNAISIPIGTI